MLKTPFTYIENLQLYNFRNYSSAEIKLAPFSVLLGENGSGKTNLLEAVSLLSPGKGLRSANLPELINNNNNSNFLIDCKIHSQFGINNITIKSFTDQLTGALKKTYLLDNEAITKQATLGQYTKPIWITPKMDTFFLEDNSNIRKFFDRLIYNFDPNHLGRLNAYNQAIKERNKLLKTNNNNHSWLLALEEVIAERGCAVAATRLDFIHKLNQILLTEGQKFSNIEVSIDGMLENYLSNNTALATENFFKQELLNSRKNDFLSGTTSIGVHKSIFNVTNLTKNINAKMCSTGEQKLMLITIIMALTNLLLLDGNNPILLLDELLVHLDENVRNNLLHHLLAMNIQCLITTTDIDVLGNYHQNFNIFNVKNNSIQ